MIAAETVVWLLVCVCLIGAALFVAEEIEEGRLDEDV